MAEIERSQILPTRAGATLTGRRLREAPAASMWTVADVPRPGGIHGWIERARAEGVRFPLDEYNARIPHGILERALQRSEADLDLAAPWSEHFRPATEDDVLALLSGAE